LIGLTLSLSGQWWPLLAAPHPSAGLWVGEVTFSGVNEAASAVYETSQVPAPSPNQPTPTSGNAHLRLLLHVDHAGKVSLLKRVTVINKAASGLTPELVLLTDDSLLSKFKGNGRRFSAAAFDFGDKSAHDYAETVSEILITNITDLALAANIVANMNALQF